MGKCYYKYFKQARSEWEEKEIVLVYLSLLPKQSKWMFNEMQFNGGPLGRWWDQWSDLITVLYVLGRDLAITSELEQCANMKDNLFHQLLEIQV